MDANKREILLKLAKDSIESVIKGIDCDVPETDDPELIAHCGCFVTIKKGEELRGCIGNFASDKPLIQLVHDMAISAATDDPRFFHQPITVKELKRLSIEISVLSPLKKTNDPMSLRLGIDGIFIRRGFASGCFLPQVAIETGWDKEEFLCYCCEHKAGLPPHAWKDPKTEVYLFTAEVF